MGCGVLPALLHSSGTGAAPTAALPLLPPAPLSRRCRSTFRDFPAEHLLPASAAGPAAAAGAGGGGPAYPLNPWQVRHATLVVAALSEVNELRFVLCPK